MNIRSLGVNGLNYHTNRKAVWFKAKPALASGKACRPNRKPSGITAVFAIMVINYFRLCQTLTHCYAASFKVNRNWHKLRKDNPE